MKKKLLAVISVVMIIACTLLSGCAQKEAKSSGEVIGINQSIYNPDNNISNIGIGFAIPINDAKKLIQITKITSAAGK